MFGLSLETILNLRESELQDIAYVLEISTNHPNWKNSVLEFCLEFHDRLENWNNDDTFSSYEIKKCDNRMIQISRKKSVSEILQILHVINKIAEDYESTKRKWQ